MSTVQQFYDIKKNRLVYINKGSDSEYWDSFWSEQKLPDPIVSSAPHVKLTKKYLPLGSVLLEGGCGLGDKVNGLTFAGYPTIGIDFAEDTVKHIKKQYPDLDIRLGDVRNLPLENDSVDGYWSLGVIEHFWDGYDDILSEAYRVIKPGGYLFLSFPSMSILRRMKAFLGRYPEMNTDSEEPQGFYQFVLDEKKLKAELAGMGFQCVSLSRKATEKGIQEELTYLHKLLIFLNRLKPAILPRIIQAIVYRTLTNFCGHSSRFVLKKV